MHVAAATFDDRTLRSQFWRRLGWKRLMLAVSVSMVFSTQLLFQENVFEHFSISETLESLALYFMDILLIAVLLACTISLSMCCSALMVSPVMWLCC